MKGKKTGGRTKGTPNKATVDKELHREKLRQLVVDELGPMTLAQIENAKGIKYLVTRSKSSGKFIRVTEAMAKVKQQGKLAPDGLADLAHHVVARGTLTEKDLPLISSLLQEWEAARVQLHAHASDEEEIEVWEKDPNTPAYTELVNRALDRSAEQVKVTGADGGPVEHVFRWRK